MKNRMGLVLRMSLPVCACLLIGTLLVRWILFGDSFVFVTVEESSLNAITGWPLTMPEPSQVFIDTGEKILVTPGKKNLLGICLGVYYSASPGSGIPRAPGFVPDRQGSVGSHCACLFVAPGIDGEAVELVNNLARVVSGKLKIVKTRRDGTVELEYGSKRIVLGPGESWAELLVLEPGGPRAISADRWKEELDRCVRLAYPATRLAIANRGFWPKSGVKAGIAGD